MVSPQASKHSYIAQSPLYSVLIAMCTIPTAACNPPALNGLYSTNRAGMIASASADRLNGFSDNVAAPFAAVLVAAGDAVLLAADEDDAAEPEPKL